MKLYIDQHQNMAFVSSLATSHHRPSASVMQRFSYMFINIPGGLKWHILILSSWKTLFHVLQSWWIVFLPRDWVQNCFFLDAFTDFPRQNGCCIILLSMVLVYVFSRGLYYNLCVYMSGFLCTVFLLKGTVMHTHIHICSSDT